MLFVPPTIALVAASTDVSDYGRRLADKLTHIGSSLPDFVFPLSLSHSLSLSLSLNWLFFFLSIESECLSVSSNLICQLSAAEHSGMRRSGRRGSNPPSCSSSKAEALRRVQGHRHSLQAFFTGFPFDARAFFFFRRPFSPIPFL